MSDKPSLLRIPQHFQTVDEVLGCASQLKLPNILVLSEREDGAIIYLDNGLTMAEANWLMDRMKAIMLASRTYAEPQPR